MAEKAKSIAETIGRGHRLNVESVRHEIAEAAHECGAKFAPMSRMVYGSLKTNQNANQAVVKEFAERMLA